MTENSVRLAQPDDQTGWNDYVSLNPNATHYHRFEIASFISSVFRQYPLYCMSVDADGVVNGILPAVRLKSLVFGHYCVSLPYFNYGGVVADSPAVAKQLIDKAITVADQHGCSHFEFRHQDAVGDELQLRSDKLMMYLPLPGDYDALLSGFKSKLRSQIRRAAKAGAIAQVGGIELVDQFYQVFSENMRDLGTPVYSRQFFRKLMACEFLNPRIVIIAVNGEPAAAGFLVSDGRRMEIPWASSRRKFNSISANMMLYGEVLRTAINTGCDIFDFGRSTVDSGTYRFKKQWGAEPIPLSWQYWLAAGQDMPGLSPDNPKFSLAIKAWQNLPLPVANLIGPHLVRSLP